MIAEFFSLNIDSSDKNYYWNQKLSQSKLRSTWKSKTKKSRLAGRNKA